MEVCTATRFRKTVGLWSHQRRWAKTNEVDGVGLGNVIGMQGIWNMVWRWHIHMKMQGVSRSLQYIGSGSLLWKHLQRA